MINSRGGGVKLLRGKNRYMKRLLLLGTIAALALTTTGQVQSVEQRQVEQPVVARHSVNPQTRVVAPSTGRNVVRSYRNGYRYYYNGGRYYGGYYNEPSVSVGIGGYYPGYYDYSYG